MSSGYAEKLPAGCEKERIARPSTGGRTAGYLFIPEGKSPMPAVVAIHGGFADGSGVTMGNPDTEAAGHIYAARLCPAGFAVLSVDYRWSAFGMEEMEDVTGAFDYLGTRREIDAARIAVMGGSHGGYMAMMAVSSAEHRRPFRAAINLYGFVDLLDLVRATREKDNPQVRLTEAALGAPDRQVAAYQELSPRHNVARLNVPVLIIVGAEDPFLVQLRGLREKLIRAGKAHEYHEIEGARHGFVHDQEPYTTILWNHVIGFLQSTTTTSLSGES